jgi:hypothetical protein
MLLGLVQGGELFNLLNQDSYDGVGEKNAKFNAAGILEGLPYKHVVPWFETREHLVIVYLGFDKVGA